LKLPLRRLSAAALIAWSLLSPSGIVWASGMAGSATTQLLSTGSRVADFNFENIGQNLGGMAVRGVVNAGVNQLVYGEKAGSFGNAFRQSLVSDLAAVGANAVGQTDFDPVTRALAHAGVGALAAKAGGKDAASGAIGAAGASLLNPIIDKAIGGEDGSGWGNDLKDAQRNQSLTLQATSMLATGAVANALGRDAVTAASAAQNETLNNYLTKSQIENKTKALANARTDADRQKIQNEYAALDAKQRDAAAACLLSGNCESVTDRASIKAVLAELNAACAPPRACSADARAGINELNKLYAKADALEPNHFLEEMVLGGKVINTVGKAVAGVWEGVVGARGGATALDWSRISARTGGDAAEHVTLNHGALSLTKPNQGVFYGNPVSTIEDAWAIAQQNGLKPVTVGNRDIYVVPRQNSGYAGGMGGQLENYNHVTIITEAGTSRVVTGYPSGGTPPLPKGYNFSTGGW